MKKKCSIILVFVLLLNWFMMPYLNVSAIDEKVTLEYKNFNIPIQFGKYGINVWNVDTNYFNSNNPLLLKLVENLDTYDYKLELFHAGDTNLLELVEDSTTNNEMLFSITNELQLGEYVLQITINNTDTYTIEFGYYYYNEATISSNYQNNDLMINNKNQTNGPDFTSVNNLIVNKTRLINDNSLNLTLSAFNQFDKAKAYRYEISYEIFEQGVLQTGTVVESTPMTITDTVNITVNNISESLNLANKQYALIVNIYEQFGTDLLFSARANYNLYPFLIEGGTIMLEDGTKLGHNINEYHTKSDIAFDKTNVTKDKTYKLSTSINKLIADKDYFYLVSIYNKGQLVKTISQTEKLSGLQIEEGIDIRGIDIIENTFDTIKLEISETALKDSNSQISSYEYQLLNILVKNSNLILKNNNHQLLVKAGITIDEIKDLITLNEVAYDKSQITFTNLFEGKLVTGTKMQINYNNVKATEYEIIVLGDLNSDGDITMSDVVTLRKHLAGIQALPSNIILAADTNDDNDLTMSDVVTLRKHLAGIEIL